MAMHLLTAPLEITGYIFHQAAFLKRRVQPKLGFLSEN
jgi:hypothetical protein